MTGNRVEPTGCRTPTSNGTWAARAGALVLVLGMSACSSVPDYANPVEWYRSTTDTVGGWFGDDEPTAKSATANTAKKSTSANGKYPNLASVPAKPTRKSTSEERAKLKDQLASDRANARYTDQKSAPAAASAATASTVTKAAAAPVASASRPAAPAPVKSAPPRQQARLSSGIYAGQRSTLWPNSPPPTSQGDRATTSAMVGKPDLTHLAKTTRPAAGMTKKMPEVPKTTTALAPAPAPAPVPTPTPAAASAPAPKLSLTPPASLAPAPTTGDQIPKFQLTAPTDQTAVEGSLGGQFRFPMFADNGSGATDVIQFGHGSARLSASDRKKIANLAREAVRSGAFVRVVGHASMRTRDMDPFKHTVANFNMSLKRANAVALALIDSGLPAEQMIVDAVGDTEPLFSEAMPSGERGNRRTEIFLETS